MAYQTIQGLRPGSVNLNSQPARQQVQPQRKQGKGKGLLQFAVPTLTAILGGLVGGPPGALAGGAGGAGLLNLLGGGREGESPQGAALKDVLYSLAGLGAGRVAGPIIGKALGKGVGKITGEGTEQVSKLGTKITAAAGRPKVDVSPFMAREEGRLTNLGTQLGLKGSARSKLEKLPSVFDDLDAQVKGLLGTKQVPVKLASLNKNFKTALGETNYLVGDKTYQKSLSEMQKRVGTIASGKTAFADDIYKLKSKLRNELGPAFKKEGVGTSLQPKEEVKLALFRSLKTTLDDIDPAIRQLNQVEADLFPISKGLAKAATEKTGLPILGSIPGMTGPRQALQDLTGRAIGTAPQAARQGMTAGAIGGAALGGLPNEPNQPPAIPEETTMGQQGANFVSEVSDNGSQLLRNPDTGEILTGDGKYRWNPQVDDWEAIQGAEQGLEAGTDAASQLRALIEQRALSGDLKNLGSQISALNTLYPQEETKQSEQDVFIDKAVDNIDNILGKEQAGYGPLAGRGASLSLGVAGGAGVSSNVVDLNERYSLLKLNILRAYQGARISDADFKLAQLYTPSISDTENTARVKLQTLREILTGRQQNPLPIEQAPTSGLENLQFPE